MDPETRQKLRRWTRQVAEERAAARWTLAQRLEELRSIVEEAGSQSAVARELGISRQALNERLRKEE